MHFAEYFCHGSVAAFVHSKTLSVPVTGRTELFQLPDNPAAILFFPFPGSFQKTIPAKILFLNALFF